MALQHEADLPPGVTCLKHFDALLRCPICFDLVSIAMMTKCSHNFCSLCIRKSLSVKLQCPVCNLSANEQDLRNNRVLDELVTGFRPARQELSNVSFDSPPLSPSTPAAAVAPACRTPRTGPPPRSGSLVSHFFQKAPKGSPSTPPTPVRLRGTAPGAGRTRDTRTQASGGVDSWRRLVIKTEPLEEELGSGPKEDTGPPVSLAPAPGGSPPAEEEDTKPVFKVVCPVCNVGISQQLINRHLDSCLNRGAKKDSLRSCLPGSMRPMGKLVYNLLSLSDLRRRLRASHLSVRGNRDQLVRRHQEFVHAYNAQCDSLSPKSAEEIAKEVEANEKTRTELQGTAKPVLVFSKNQSEGEIDEMHSKYRKQHSAAFSDLVAQVRGRLKAGVKQEVVPEGDVAEGSHRSGSKAAGGRAEGLSTALQTGQEDAAPVSPSGSDVSISSSVSDIFGPETQSSSTISPQRNPAQKRPPAFRDEEESPLALGKRRRQT